MKPLVLLAALLAGCSHSAWHASTGTPPPPSNTGAHLQVSATGGFAAVLGMAVITVGTYEYVRGGYAFESTRPPELAPERKVNEVDCSKPFDPTLGNIRCK